MALTDKDILITPNIGSASEPKIEFKGASASVGPSTITATIYPTSNGTLSFDGTEGSLFSIVNNLSTGSIFSVNPISGIPIIDVNADRTISLNPYGGNTGIGLTNPSQKLHVQGNVRITGALYDSNNDAGTSGQVLVSTGSGIDWASQGSGGGLDADTLDGLNSTQFLRSDANDEATGVIDFLGGSGAVPAVRVRSGGSSWSEGLAIHPSTDNSFALAFFRTRASLTDNTNTWAIGNLGEGGTNNFGLLRNGLTGSSAIRVDAAFDVTQAGVFRFGFTPTVGSNTIWHAGNDGAGSGLDADLLDGKNTGTSGNTIPLLDGANTWSSMQVFYAPLTDNEDYLNSPISIRERGAAGAGDGEDRDSPNLNFHWSGVFSKSLWMGANGYLNWGEYDASGIPQSDGIFRTSQFISTVATGTAPLTVSSTTLVTNLNADLLDGQQGTYYLDYNNFSNTPTIGNGTLTLNVSGTGLSGSQTFTANQTGNATFTVTSNATSANTESTIVARDASGNFSAGTITATLSGNAATASQLVALDDRTIEPNSINAGRLQFGFTSWSNNQNAPYADYLHLRSYVDASGGNDNLVMFLKDGIGMRIYQQSFGSASAYSSYADVILNTGGTFIGQIQSTRANDTTTGGGQIYLNGATGNRIDFNQNGVAAPTTTTRSVGTKIVLYPNIGASIVDFAFGIEGATLWSSVPSSGEQFKWYAGTTSIATLTGAGNFSVNGTTDNIVANESGSSSGWRARILSKNSDADKSSFLGVYGTAPGVFAHNHALNAWDKLFVNTTNGSSDGADVTIAGSGNLGLGVASPVVKFHIQNSNSTYTSPESNNVPTAYLYNASNSSASAHSILSVRTGGGNGGNPFVSFDIYNVVGYSMGIDNADSDKFKISKSWNNLSTNNYFTIDGTGNVGINSTSPGSTLSVGGTITELYNGTYWNVVSQADIGYNANQIPLNQYLGQLAFLDDYSPNGLRRDGGSVDDVVVNSSGFVTIGNNQPSSAAGRFNVKPHDSQDSYLKIRPASDFDGTLTSGAVLDVRNSVNSDSHHLIFRAEEYRFWCGDSGGEKVRINSGGDVGIKTINPSYTLDVNGTIRGERFRGINSLVLNTYTTVNPASNVFLYSQPNDRDSWIYLDSADTGSNWGIYHRQIDSAVSGLPANSIGFIGGGSNTLQSYISLANGNAYFAGNLGVGAVSPSYKLDVQSSSNDVLSIKGGTNATFMVFDNNSLDDYKIGGVNAVAPFVVYNNTDARYEMVFDGTGKVGIGTINPLQTLHVQGNQLVAADGDTTKHITQKPYTINGGTLSWEGSAGQLFSITNNLTSGSIFSVNDVSGIPSIDVDANGTIQLGPYGGNIGVGVTNPTQKLDVNGGARFRGAIYDVNNSAGTNGQVLKSTGVGVTWVSGSGSGIDADLLDGQQGSYYRQSWPNIDSGTRTNYTLGFQPLANNYAGFYFSKSTSSAGSGDAGYLLVRGTSDSDVYTPEGITLVADAGWLTLAQRTTASRGVRIMSGTTTSTERLKVTTAGDIQFVNGSSFTYNSNVILHIGNTARTNYKDLTDTVVTGQMMWKNYGNNHTIFDASNSTSPSGTAVNNTNSQIAWTTTYPTLMGWNGANTYGVRVDSARISDSSGTVSISSLAIPDPGTTRYVNFTSDNSGYQQIYGSSALTYVESTGTLSATRFQSTQANNTADNGGQIFLNGATGNRIDFNQNGVAAPTTTTRSVGTKIVLYPAVAVGASEVDYAFGIESNTMWSSVPGSYAQFKWYAGTTNIATLSGAGNLTVSGTVTANSDIKLKTNIKTIENALEKVTRMRGVEFDRVDMENSPHQIGVIAQEMEEVIPEVVFDNQGTKSVAYGNIVSVLIEAIKEQQTQIEELKSMVNLLINTNKD